MNHTSYFASTLTDEAVWQQLHILLQEWSPDTTRRQKEYTHALEQLQAVGGDAQALDQAYRSAIVSDAMFAFQKGMETNLFHFQHPQVPSFAQVGFEDMYQECVMAAMPKRVDAEKIIVAIESEYFHEDLPWCEVVREYIIDLEVTIPKLMHFGGYLAGNRWFALTVPGYQEDQALTSIYRVQLSEYFGSTF